MRGVGVTSVFFAITLATVLLRYDVRDLGFDLAQAKTLLNDAWPIGLSMAAISVYYYFDRILMAEHGQIEAVGWYSAAYAPIMWVTAFIGVIRTAFLPAHSRALAEDSDARPFLRFYGHVSLLLGVPVALVGIFLAGDALRIVYGADYVAGTFAFQVLCLTAGLMFLSSMYGSQLPLLGRQRLLLADVLRWSRGQRQLEPGIRADIQPRWGGGGNICSRGRGLPADAVPESRLPGGPGDRTLWATATDRRGGLPGAIPCHADGGARGGSGCAWPGTLRGHCVSTTPWCSGSRNAQAKPGLDCLLRSPLGANFLVDL